jgi:hypothetical protein
MRLTIAGAAVLLACSLPPGASRVSAQDEPMEQGKPGEWVLSSTLGAGVARGEYGDFLEKPVNFDLNISKGTGAWRFGGGIQFGSMTMKPPYDGEKEWARFDTYLLARRSFNPGGTVRPYFEGRVGVARIHPRSELFWFDDPENLDPGASPTAWANGVSYTLQPGVEIQVHPGVSLDVSAWWAGYWTGEYSTTPPLDRSIDPPVSEKDPVRSGQEYGFKAGLTWRPLAQGVTPLPPPMADPSTGTLKPLPPPSGKRDAWGVSRSWGWATAEMLAINFGASMFNEYVRKANFNQISPRSWYDNFKTGFTYDDNKFKTNQLIHPFNGSTYFNSARANGIGFWGSSAMSLVGAFVWECCGETHPMSWNDMVSTGIGGVARGEWAYRLGSAILDNTDDNGRIWREIAALPVNPVNQFNRFLSGRATRVQGNPENPYDWRPPNFGFQLMAGARIIGEGESISENTNTYGFIAADIQYGSAFYNERRRPYDRFDTTMQLNYGDKTRVGELTIRGDLASWVVGNPEDPKHVVAIVQDFDYIDNEAYEYGGQGFGVGYYSGHGAPMGTRFVSRLVAYGVASAAVNSDYSFLADVANRERFREYDYGPGVGVAAEGILFRNSRPIVDLRYRYTYIDVRNGSLWNPDPEDNEGGLEGSSANHQVHRFKLRVNVPITRDFALGAEGIIFYRDSKYSLEALKDVTQRNPEVRVFVTWDLGYTRRRAQRAAATAGN